MLRYRNMWVGSLAVALSFGCTTIEPKCDIYDRPCLIEVTLNHSMVSKPTGGKITAQLKNYANEIKDAVRFQLQQDPVAPVPVTLTTSRQVAKGQFEFDFELSCQKLSSLHPGSVQLSVTDETSAGTMSGSATFPLQGASISYSSEPLIMRPAVKDNKYGELISIGFLNLKTTKTVVALQHGFNPADGTLGRVLVPYSYSGMPAPSLTEVATGTISPLNTVLQFGTATKGYPRPAAHIRGDRLVYTQFYVPLEKLRLSSCQFTALDATTCALYGDIMPNAMQLADSGVELDVDGSSEYTLILDHSNSANPRIQYADLKAPMNNLVSVATGGKSMTLIDLDVDGDDDLVVVTSDGKNLSVFENKQKSFSANSLMKAALDKAIAELAIANAPISFVRRGDVNGDNVPDLLIVQDTNVSSLQIYARDCTNLVRSAIKAPKTLRDITVGLINMDMVPDIIAITGGPTFEMDGKTPTNLNQFYIYLGQQM